MHTDIGTLCNSLEIAIHNLLKAVWLFSKDDPTVVK